MRIAEIEARLQAAYSGRWALAASSNGGAILLRGPEGPARDRHPQSHLQIVPEDDAAFIASSRDDVAWLIAQLRAAREDAKRLDWIEKQPFFDMSYAPSDDEDLGWVIYDEDGLPVPSDGVRRGLRDAIDAAIAAVPSPGYSNG